jgi:hypothetical protein
MFSQLSRRTPLRRTPFIKKSKGRSTLANLGRKGKAWAKVRREIKPEHERMGNVTCELRLDGCWINNALTWAHPKKRRHTTHKELPVVILACAPCHDKIEVLGEPKMKRIVERVIRERGQRFDEAA